MGSLPWVKIDVDIPSHPKLLHLQELLGTEDGLGVIIRMFCWAAKFCPSGKVPKQVGRPLAAEAIRGAVTRNGYSNADSCLEALQLSGWLEEHAEHYEVHDWADFQGAHIDAARKNRERQQQYRDRNKKAARHVTRRRNGDITTLDEMRGDEKRVVEQEQRAPNTDAARYAKATEQPPDPWPADLLEQLRGPLKRKLQLNDPEWATYILATSRKYPLQVRVNAGLVLLERAIGGKTFSLGYLSTLLEDRAEPRAPRRQNGFDERVWTEDEKERDRRRLQPPPIPEDNPTRDELNARALARAEADLAAQKRGAS